MVGELVGYTGWQFNLPGRFSHTRTVPGPAYWRLVKGQSHNMFKQKPDYGNHMKISKNPLMDTRRQHVEKVHRVMTSLAKNNEALSMLFVDKANKNPETIQLSIQGPRSRFLSVGANVNA